MPSRPAAPTLTSATSTDMILAFTAPSDNGGDIIDSYELQMATGTGSYSNVATYTDNSLSHTLTVGANGLVAGGYYRFIFRAVNSEGNSEYSDELRAALSPLPAQPSAPTKNDLLSSQTSIAIEWAKVAD